MTLPGPAAPLLGPALVRTVIPMTTNLQHLEARLEVYLRGRVRRLFGGYLVKLSPSEVGLPDRLVVLPEGRMYLVELKADQGRVSAKQEHVHARLALLDVEVHVLRGRAEIDEWVRARAREMGPQDTPRRRQYTRHPSSHAVVEEVSLGGTPQRRCTELGCGWVSRPK